MKKKYRVWIYFFVAVAALLMFATNCKKDAGGKVPEMTTSFVTNFTVNSANCGGNIISDGGSAIIQRGVCWSLGATPTIADNKTNDGTGAGSFTSHLTGLEPDKTYYVRAYATNSAGTAYGSIISFKTPSILDKYWITTALTIDPPVMIGSTAVTDIFSQMDACIKDNLQKFQSGGTYVFDEGSSKCSSGDPQTINGTWSYNPDKTIISVTWGANTRSYLIIEFTATSLKMKYNEVDDWGSGNLNYTYTITSVVH